MQDSSEVERLTHNQEAGGSIPSSAPTLSSMAIQESVATAEVRSDAAERTDPAGSVLALEMLAQGKGATEVTTATGMTFSQISALRGRHQVALDVRRQMLSADGFELAEKHRLLLHKKLDDLNDDAEGLKKTPLKDLNTGYAIMQDKALQAVEGNKVTIEHKKAGVSLAEAKAAIEAARERAMKKVHPEAIEV